MKHLINADNFAQLSAEELQAINGGAASESSISLNGSTSSLLSLNFEWKQGDMSKSYKLSVGNDITAGLSAYGHSVSYK